MIEKDRRSIKYIRKKNMARGMTGQRGRDGLGTEKKKISMAWLSPDSFMGKALCILLVIILTVGAFLAPKVINNLYDAGTLMQITYMDMDLSPYAVSYVKMEDKLQAIARVKTAGGFLSVLPVGEEAEGGVSGAELAEAVNREVGELRWGLGTFFSEAWWSTLTEGSLVSRTKYTLYGRPDGEGNDTSKEMAPFQFWVLQFVRVESSDEEGKENKYLTDSDDITDRIMVCMDADFDKIYAFAVAGNVDRIEEVYGLELMEIFDKDGEVRGYAEASLLPEERQRLRIDLTADIMAGWAEYWDTVPEERAYYMDVQNELVGVYVYRDEESAAKADGGGKEGSVGVDSEEETTEIVVDAKTGMTSQTELSEAERRALALEKAVMGYGQEGERLIYNYEAGEAFLFSAEEIETSGFKEEGDMLLTVGAQGQAVRGEESTAVWIQKTGCRDFFDMMQF